MERAQFESLIRQHWPAVRAIANRFATGADAADICQDVVLIAWRRREQVQEAAGFGPWVKRIALNVGRTHSRRREGRLGAMQEGDRPTPDPSQEVVDRCALEQALAELNQRERLTVEAHHLLGWPLADIAAAFREPLGTTKARLSRARGKLRRELYGLGWTRLGRREEERR